MFYLHFIVEGYIFKHHCFLLTNVCCIKCDILKYAYSSLSSSVSLPSTILVTSSLQQSKYQDGKFQKKVNVLNCILFCFVWQELSSCWPFLLILWIIPLSSVSRVYAAARQSLKSWLSFQIDSHGVTMLLCRKPCFPSLCTSVWEE